VIKAGAIRVVGLIKFFLRLLQLVLGLFLFAAGIVLCINANIGYAPWDVLNAGLVLTIGVSFGFANIITALAILVAVVILKEKFGLGTILNVILVGVYMDFILYLNIIPTAANYFSGILMMIAGIFVLAFASYFYISSAFSTGPRDSLMVAINRRTPLPVGVCRAITEICAVGAGWLLGGKVGVGTVVYAVFIGPCIQVVFNLLKFDAAKIKHETLAQTYKTLISRRVFSKK
jgi:uncharacterized membrane protein YczE